MKIKWKELDYSDRVISPGKYRERRKLGSGWILQKEQLMMEWIIGERGLAIYNKQKDRQSPMGKMKSLFGGEMEMDGGNVFTNAKKAYNKNIKNSKLGTALRKSTGNILGDVYDKGENQLGRNKYTKPISEYMRDSKKGNVDKLTKLSGVGLRLQGKGMRLSGAGSCKFCGAGNDKFLFGDQAL